MYSAAKKLHTETFLTPILKGPRTGGTSFSRFYTKALLIKEKRLEYNKLKPMIARFQDRK